jgi:hypothetical protein
VPSDLVFVFPGLKSRSDSSDCIGALFPLPNRRFTAGLRRIAMPDTREDSDRAGAEMASTSLGSGSRLKITLGGRLLSQGVPKGQRRENLVGVRGAVKLPDPGRGNVHLRAVSI